MSAPRLPETSRAHGSLWQPPDVSELQALLPQYEIIELLGRGGMGAVYKARQLSLRRVVAIKVLPRDLTEDGQLSSERFRHEAIAMAQLSHPSIVNVYDAGEAGGRLLYIVMEYVGGHDLAQELAARERLPEAQVKAITLQICAALGYLHSHGIVHRDIKPANILLEPNGHVKVADFGIAKLDDSLATHMLTRTGTSLGTEGYMAPECQRARGPVDGRADLFSLGVMLYQMLTGKLPRGMFKVPCQTDPELDSKWDDLTCRALEPEPQDRFQSAEEMQAAIERVVRRTAVARAGAGRPSSTQRIAEGKSRRKRLRRMWAAGTIAVLATAGYVITAAFDWEGTRGSEQEKGTPAKPLQPDRGKNLAIGAQNAPELKLWDDPAKLPAVQGVEWREGALRLHDVLLQYHELLSTDAILRAQVCLNRDARLQKLCLRGAGAWRNESRYEMTLLGDEKRVQLELVTAQERTVFGKWPLPKAYDADEWPLLELRAVGDEISAYVDGHLLASVRDGTVAGPGRAQLYAKANGLFRNIVYIPLHSKARPTGVEAVQAHGRVVDLLPAINLQRDAITGQWSCSGNDLTVQAGPEIAGEEGLPRLQLPYVPPAEYDFEIEFTPESGYSGVAQLLATENRQFSWVVDVQLEAGRKAGFETINGERVVQRRDGTILRKSLLKNGQTHRGRVEVRRTGLRGFLDGELLVSWGAEPGSLERLGLLPALALRDAQHLGIAADERRVRFHKIQVREISGPGRLDASAASSAAK